MEIRNCIRTIVIDVHIKNRRKILVFIFDELNIINSLKNMLINKFMLIYSLNNSRLIMFIYFSIK